MDIVTDSGAYKHAANEIEYLSWYERVSSITMELAEGLKNEISAPWKSVCRFCRRKGHSGRKLPKYAIKMNFPSCSGFDDYWIITKV